MYTCMHAILHMQQDQLRTLRFQALYKLTNTIVNMIHYTLFHIQQLLTLEETLSALCKVCYTD